VQEAALAWLDQLQKGEISVSVRLADLDHDSARFGSVPRLIAAAIVISGVLIGSALAATTNTGQSSFRTNLADVALVVYVVATAIASVVAVALLWRLLRPEGRRGRRRRTDGRRDV
jgi:hypothetical protein